MRYHDSTRVAVTSDWHLDARFGQLERWPEFLEFTAWLGELLVEREIDWLLVLGDYCDPGKGGLELLWAARLELVALELHSKARRGSVWIAGNHDVVRSSSGATTLSPLAAAAPPNMYVLETPALVPWGERCRLLALPYPCGDRERHRAAEDDAFVAASEDVELPIMVIGHLALTGARTGTESTDMARGSEHPFPVARVLDAGGGAPICAMNGHYHKPQVVNIDGLDVLVPGSALRLDAGERGDDCSVVIVDF